MGNIIIVVGISALILINFLTVFMFWADKARAIDGQRRIPEADLLTLAMLGGSPGAFIARRLFHHKTRKQPFTTNLMLIAIIQIGLVVGWLLFPIVT
jgi:uncharacterized membrane protein YsdA (DUF1294 family)